MSRQEELIQQQKSKGTPSLKRGELPERLKIRSENLEPAFQHLIGHWHAQCMYLKETCGPHSVEFVDAMGSWWYGMRQMSRLMIACPGQAQHAQVAINNHMLDIKRLIQHELGIEFSFMDGESLNFRQLVKFEIEFGF